MTFEVTLRHVLDLLAPTRPAESLQDSTFGGSHNAYFSFDYGRSDVGPGGLRTSP